MKLVIIIIIIIMGVFHISVNWWSFTGVWETANLFKFPGLFSVFWLSSIMLYFAWSPLVLLFPSPPIPLIILCDCTKSTNHNWHNCHLQFFFFNSLARSRYLSSFSFLSILFCSQLRQQSPQFYMFSHSLFFFFFFFFVVDYYKVWSSD